MTCHWSWGLHGQWKKFDLLHEPKFKERPFIGSSAIAVHHHRGFHPFTIDHHFALFPLNRLPAFLLFLSFRQRNPKIVSFFQHVVRKRKSTEPGIWNRRSRWVHRRDVRQPVYSSEDSRRLFLYWITSLTWFGSSGQTWFIFEATDWLDSLWEEV